MTPCELCGKDTQLFRAVVEGSELNVCQGCGRFGKIIRRAQPIAPKPKPQPASKKEIVETVVEGYAKLIREAREKSGMTQKDFAKALNERESIIKKLEGGMYCPPLSLAHKLEKLLKITLVKQEEEDINEPRKGKRDGPLTIGDILQIKS